MTAKPGSPAVAYSYIRFSTAEQLKGDSLRRQTQATEEWCRRNGVILDTSTTLHDLGKSAFVKGKRAAREDDGMATVLELADLVNPDRRALAGFLEVIKRRKVVRGAYLVIENLDRLSRDDTVPATHLLTGILLAGVRVVQLRPVEQVLTERSDGYAILMAVMELSRGNSESRLKSERIGGAWVNKRAHARAGTPLTRNVPAWVRVESVEHGRYTLALIPERAEVVSRIFSLAASGLGLMRVVQKLTEDKVPAFGRLLDEAGIAEYEGRRRAEGKPLTPKERAALRRPGHWRKGEWVHPAWNRAYVHDILTDRRALGEYLPRARRGLADGPPIADYFPAVVDEATFAAARAALAKRKPGEGRRGAECRIGKHIDLFSGLIFDAVDGSPYYAATKTEGRGSRRQRRAKEPGSHKRHSRVLVNSAAGEGRSPTRSFPLPTFEQAVVSLLREIDPREVLGETSPAAEVAALERQARWLANRQTELAAELRNGDIPAIARQLRQLNDEEKEVAAKLDEARQQVAKPLGARWHDLTALLDGAADPDVRRRLRCTISRIVETIWLLVVPRGRDRLAAVQFKFTGGGATRNYVILHRPPLWVGTALRPGNWCASSLAEVAAPGDLDLRRRDHARRLEKVLATMDLPTEVESGNGRAV
jgi:DNA invertase Pin-like site-specific DNA recombinase